MQAVESIALLTQREAAKVLSLCEKSVFTLTKNGKLPAVRIGKSVRYDRAAGYFSSTMLAVAAAGVTKLILNGGQMRLLCGADLAEHDVAAINEGHSTLAQLV